MDKRKFVEFQVSREVPILQGSRNHENLNAFKLVRGTLQVLFPPPQPWWYSMKKEEARDPSQRREGNTMSEYPLEHLCGTMQKKGSIQSVKMRAWRIQIRNQEDKEYQKALNQCGSCWLHSRLQQEAARKTSPKDSSQLVENTPDVQSPRPTLLPTLRPALCATF